MEDLRSATREFLNDRPVLAMVSAIDKQRERSLPELRDAFMAFREGAPFSRLEGAIRDHMVQVFQPTGGPPLNLWGFRNEDESHFAARLLNVCRKVEGLDLDGLFRENLLEDGDDSERIQVLLAFGEFVAGLDAHGGAEGGARLGMGPATHFLTFAWHCLSEGHEPVFTYVSDRAIWALATAGGLGDMQLSREWEPRLASFYDVARQIQAGSQDLPRAMRPGWAVEHVLGWAWAQLDTDSPAPAPAPVVSVASEPEPARSTRDDRVSQISKGKTYMEGKPEPTKAQQKARRDLGLPKRNVRRVETRMFDKSGLSMDEALPPDRTTTTPPKGMKRPKRSSPEPTPAEPVKTAAMWMREHHEAEQEKLNKKLRKIERDGISSEDAAVPPPARSPEPARKPEPARVIRGEPRKPTTVIQGRSRIAQDGNLARELFLEPVHLDEILASLEERGRVLLVGPPLSGKTHLARRLALHAAGHIERVVVFRMHHEQDYEKLMGTRGLVRKLCEQASADRTRSYSLVLDELDAGDAARALGELPAALVERAEAVTLPSGAQFSVPRNLNVIATARVEPLDPALVGRFPLVGLPSNPDVLRRYLDATRPGHAWVADMLQSLNAKLRALGQRAPVGQGAFMDPELDALRARRIWNRTVLPLVRAQGVDDGSLGYDALGGR